MQLDAVLQRQALHHDLQPARVDVQAVERPAEQEQRQRRELDEVEVLHARA